MLGLSLKLLAEYRILRGNAHRTSIQVALAHHDAAHGDQGRGGESKFLRAQQRGNYNIASGLQFAVRLHANSAAQVIQQQNLLGLGQTEFPGNARVLDGT